MLVLLLLSAFAHAGCKGSAVGAGNHNDNQTPGPVVFIPQSARRAVDLLFVIDDSAGSMGLAQDMLGIQISSLMSTLRDRRGGLPDLHVGVISTDLGTGPFPYTYCDDPPTGDAGNLLTRGCAYPEDASYIVDVAPRGCDVEVTDQGTCPGYAGSCTEQSCAHEPSTVLVVDPRTGCPRCRNFGDQTFGDTFQCISALGVSGCGFEQPFEAAARALDPGNTHNAGFLRSEALLAIVFLGDEDDCSAASNELFDNTETDLTSRLGPATSFRCFEFGVTCDINDRTAVGPRHDCRPREDPDALVRPVSHYVTLLEQIKDPEMLVVAAIAGPTDGGTVVVTHDYLGNPELAAVTCAQGFGIATPGVRMEALVRAFNREQDMSWAFTPSCAPTYSDALAGIGAAISYRLFRCLPAPLAGCTDVGAGLPAGPADACPDNDVCQPRCQVTEVSHRNTPNEQRRLVPRCLEVCPGGPCPGNGDPALAYAAGHPEERDPGLPVPACWQVVFDEACPESRYSRLVVSRVAEPPSGTFAELVCDWAQTVETLCTDGVDNDEDCLTDQDDPDCLR